MEHKKGFPCAVCTLNFSSKESLKKHMKSHKKPVHEDQEVSRGSNINIIIIRSIKMEKKYLERYEDEEIIPVSGIN